jgi:oligopeptide transport system permease protein
MTAGPESEAHYLLGDRARRTSERSLWEDAARRLIGNRLAMASLVIVGALVIVAVFAPVVATHDPARANFAAGAQYQGMSASHWLGTDGIGRDWYSRLVYGTRTSLAIGVFAQVIVLAIGLPIGMVAGYVGGRIDSLLMRLTDLAYAFPSLLFILLVAQVLGASTFNIFLAIGLVSWPDIARLVRGQVLSLRETDYVLAASAMGADGGRIMLRHLLPNALGPIIVSATFGIPSAIFAEAALSFIGVGLPLGTPSWGTMVNDGYSAIFGQQILVVAPAAAIAVTLLAFTFLGDGLRDALDPRTR